MDSLFRKETASVFKHPDNDRIDNEAVRPSLKRRFEVDLQSSRKAAQSTGRGWVVVVVVVVVVAVVVVVVVVVVVISSSSGGGGGSSSSSSSSNALSY